MTNIAFRLFRGAFYGTTTIKFVEKEESLLTDEANHLQVREKRGRSSMIKSAMNVSDL